MIPRIHENVVAIATMGWSEVHPEKLHDRMKQYLEELNRDNAHEIAVAVDQIVFPIAYPEEDENADWVCSVDGDPEIRKYFEEEIRLNREKWKHERES